MPSTVSTAKYAQGGELFARMKLIAEISEDTAAGRLLLNNVQMVLLAQYNPNPDAKAKDNKVPAVIQNCNTSCVSICTWNSGIFLTEEAALVL